MITSGKVTVCSAARMLAFVGIVFVLPLAGANVSDVLLTITASTGKSEASLTISADEGSWDGNEFSWSTDESLEIRDSGDHLLGTFGPASLVVSSRPQLSLGFAVEAEGRATEFTISSALRSFSRISSAYARSSAAFTLQDYAGNGALLTGNGPTGGAFLAQYNGYVPHGTTFTEAINQIRVTPPEAMVTVEYSSAPAGEYLPIGSADSMSSQFAFTLSPLSLASGSASFEIIPEPATVLLMVGGLLVARRR